MAKALLTEQQAQSVAVDKIQRFLESPLGRRLGRRLDWGSSGILVFGERRRPFFLLAFVG
ncbi:MAG: hypothetical protein ACYDEJ_06665 [Desulfitobacteriaceae bacterium]